MTANKEPNTSPGRRVGGLKDRREINSEIDLLLTERLAKGGARPIWGAGAFTRHMVLGIFEPVSLCGRYVGAISTEPMPTLIGVACPKCVRRWNAAMDVHNAEIEAANEKAITDLADELDTLLGAGQLDAFLDRWKKMSENRPLRTAVKDRLDERGVELPKQVTELPAWMRKAGTA